MKKILIAILSIAMACGIGFAAVGCNSEAKDAIVVCGREASSGTREAFDKIVAKDGKTLADYSEEANPDGELNAGYVKGAQYFSGTGLVASKVASTKGAIGYISLSSVDEETLKPLTVNGVAASEETVLDGTYAVQRPFVITTRKAGLAQGSIAEDFLKFLQSDDAQAVVGDEGLVSLTETDDRNGQALGTYDPLPSAPAEVTAGCVQIWGSTSMEDVITALMKKYREINPWMTEAGFSITLNGSSEGRSKAKDDTVGNVIGLASSESSSDSERYCFHIALDAVAVVVNKNNDNVSNITLEQLYDIYTGSVTKWSELKAEA